MNQSGPLSETCTTAKREVRSWILILLLVICSPLVLTRIISGLPEIAFWILSIGLQGFVILIMWQRCNWNKWIKIAVIAVYVIMHIIELFI